MQTVTHVYNAVEQISFFYDSRVGMNICTITVWAKFCFIQFIKQLRHHYDFYRYIMRMNI